MNKDSQLPAATAGTSAAAGTAGSMAAGGGGVSGVTAAGASGRAASSAASGSSGTAAAAAGRMAASNVGGAGASAAGGVGGGGSSAGGGAGTSVAAGSGGASGGSGAGGAAGEPATCMKGTVKASEVVFIGESFIAQTGAIPRLTTQLARTAGTIGVSESYRSFAVSGTQLTTGDIPGQFTRAKAAGPVKVVLMDGGGNDLLFGTDRCMGSYDARCKQVVDVVDMLFKQFKTDGVKDVVYFFYPDPMGIGAQIKAAMDILRPEMKKLCDGTADVRCVWVDQRDTWEGNYDKFTSDGIHPTEAGSMASAKQIWDAMVANCIAQ